MNSMKYLGTPMDPGEWWADRRSDNPAMGAGVIIYVRCACDGHIPPRIVVAYGLREDVDLAIVAEEAKKIVAAYQIEGRRVYGELIPPTIEQFQDIQKILECYKKACARGVHPLWDIRFLLNGCVGAPAVTERVIARIGEEKLEAIRTPWVQQIDGKMEKET